MSRDAARPNSRVSFLPRRSFDTTRHGGGMNTLSRITAGILVTLTAGRASMTETQRRTATSAGVGAVGGAGVGSLFGGSSGARAGAAIGTAVGAGGGYIWSKRMEDQKRALEQAAQGTGVAVTQTPDNHLKLEVPSDVSFRVGRADIEPAFRPVPDRAARVHAHLADRGVAMQRIAIDRRGAREPVADGSSDAGRARNRRVDILIGEPPVAQAPSRWADRARAGRARREAAGIVDARVAAVRADAPR
jgi:outer membrane protein OmpA-like peptidoglycan-associated protein